jgi:hypothetical protein
LFSPGGSKGNGQLGESATTNGIAKHPPKPTAQIPCCAAADRRRSANAMPAVSNNNTNDRKAMLMSESGMSKLISMALFPFACATDRLF